MDRSSGDENAESSGVESTKGTEIRETGTRNNEQPKMADELREDTSVLAGLLSTTDQLESLESLDAAFTTNTGSFRQRHVSDSVSFVRVFYCGLPPY